MLTRTKKGKIDYRCPLIHFHETNDETFNIIKEYCDRIKAQGFKPGDRSNTYSDGVSELFIYAKNGNGKGLTIIFGKDEFQNYANWQFIKQRQTTIDLILLDLETNPI
ncbi:hypothetical protein [Hymenobacter terricola]|uniref:hypothetical protein n=1 Tax=Hymenobacter terricola TaxID=2819236 RepID=UPI001B300F9B|nr:hypothetical protein [Hymenobacter terricola]